MELPAHADLQRPSLWPAREHSRSWLQRSSYHHGSGQPHNRESKSLSSSSFRPSYNRICIGHHRHFTPLFSLSPRGSKSTRTFSSLKCSHSWWAWVFCPGRRRRWMWRCLLQPKARWISTFLWTSPTPWMMTWTTWRQWAKSWVSIFIHVMAGEGIVVFILALVVNVGCFLVFFGSFIGGASIQWLHHWLWKVCGQSYRAPDRHEAGKVREKMGHPRTGWNRAFA